MSGEKKAVVQSFICTCEEGLTGQKVCTKSVTMIVDKDEKVEEFLPSTCLVWMSKIANWSPVK